jgi:hypothetical protein
MPNYARWKSENLMHRYYMMLCNSNHLENFM